MPGYLVVVQFAEAPPEDSPSDLTHEANHTGFLGASVWLGLGASNAALLLIHFADRAAAEAHLRERTERADPIALATPPTIHHLCLVESHGRTLDAAPVGTYLTSFHTLAAPGYGEETGSRIEDTLESLALLDGHAGHLRGFDVALEDEVWSLVGTPRPSSPSPRTSPTSTTTAACGSVISPSLW